MMTETFKIGDLVKPTKDLNDFHPDKTIGVVTSIDSMARNENESDFVKVCWANYGTYWTSPGTITRISSKDEDARE